MAVVLMSGAPFFAHAQNSQKQNTPAQVQDWNTPPAGTEQVQQGFRDGIEAAKLDKAARRKIDAKSSHLYKNPPVKGAASAMITATASKRDIRRSSSMTTPACNLPNQPQKLAFGKASEEEVPHRDLFLLLQPRPFSASHRPLHIRDTASRSTRLPQQSVRKIALTHAHPPLRHRLHRGHRRQPSCTLRAEQFADLSATLAALENRSKGRLGVAILFPSGKQVTHRADERFPMCSTFKFLAASLVLQRVDQGKEHLDRAVSFSKSDLVTYSPETEKHAGGSMTVAELCEGRAHAQRQHRRQPPARELRRPTRRHRLRPLHRRPCHAPRPQRDHTQRSTPGDPRDTTTPNAMLANLQRILFGNVLKPASRQQLTDWMLANTTGKPKFVAGLPSTWKVADKTGSGEHGSNNDIGVLWPPAGKPILITSYLTETALSTDERNAIHADIARAIAATLSASE